MRPIFLSIPMCLLRLQIYPQMILLMQNIEFFYQSSKGTCLNPCNAKVWIRVGLFRILTPSNDNELRFLIANMHNQICTIITKNNRISFYVISQMCTHTILEFSPTVRTSIAMLVVKHIQFAAVSMCHFLHNYPTFACFILLYRHEKIFETR